MKKYINIILVTLTLLLSVSMAAQVQAQPQQQLQPRTQSQLLDGKIKVDNVNIAENGGEVTVEFVMDIDKGTAPRNYTVVLVPIVVSDIHSVSMPAIVVQGKNVKSQMSRYEWVSGHRSSQEGVIYTGNGRRVNYKAVLPSHSWMQSVDLAVESYIIGCCDSKVIPAAFAARDIELRKTEKEVEEQEQQERGQESAPVSTSKTFAETISEGASYLADISKFDESKATYISDEERESPLAVYFKQGSSVIDVDYKNNGQALIELTKLIDMIMSDSDHKVEKITVSGYSSPEGSIQRNNELAMERALSVKRYIINTTAMTDKDISVYNGSVDWQGLRHLVAKSDMREKNQIINIIDNVPVWDSKTQKGRMGQLMRLNDGETYKYIMREYFPLLRSGAFIKVYYNNK